MSGIKGKQIRHHTSKTASVLKHCIAFWFIKAAVGGGISMVYLRLERSSCSLIPNKKKTKKTLVSQKCHPSLSHCESRLVLLPQPETRNEVAKASFRG